jgi:hypothetical protein
MERPIQVRRAVDEQQRFHPGSETRKVKSETSVLADVKPRMHISRFTLCGRQDK